MSGPSDGARTACAPNSMSVAAALHARFDLSSEAATQAGIEGVLVEVFGREVVSREHRLGPGDRPDFLIDGQIVIEVKGPRHQASAVHRQLARYAAYPEVGAIILATSRAMTMPPAIGGKPVRVLNLGRAWL